MKLGPIQYFDELESTNKYLMENSLPNGSVVIADSQKSGKGRRGRKWFSPPRKNLYLSFVLNNPPFSPSQALQLNIVTAVAVAVSVADLGIIPEIKWPNDILVSGKKIAGILIESEISSEKIRKLVVGIGINLNMDFHEIDEEIKEVATSLKIVTGEEVVREDFLNILLKKLDLWYNIFEKEGFLPVKKRWTSLFSWKGKEVVVLTESTSIKGIAIGIDENGFLLLKNERGEIEKVISGDVTLRRENASGY